MPDDRLPSDDATSTGRTTPSASHAATATACCSRCSVVLYILIAVADHRNLWGRFVISVVLGAVLLLAFHTSHVRARALQRSAVVLVVIADTRQPAPGAVRPPRQRRLHLHHVRARAAGAGRDPQPDHPPRDRRPRDHPRRDLRLRADRASRSPASTAGSTTASRPASSPSRSTPNNVDFLYFSFVTITTVGYGDLTAGTSTGRVAGDVRGAHRADLPRHAGGAPGQHVRRRAAGRRAPAPSDPDSSYRGGARRAAPR